MPNQLNMTNGVVKQRKGGTRSAATTRSIERTKIVQSSTSAFDNRGTQTRLRYKSIIIFSILQHPSPNTHHIQKVKKYAQDPLRAPRATMCQVHRHEHAECGHLQWFEAVRKCRDFSPSQNACFGHVTTLSKVKIRIPARCDDCFNRAVADIERNCNGCIAAVMREVNTYGSDIKAEPDPKRRPRLSKAKSYVKQDIAAFKKRRDDDIAELRAKQGM